MSAIAAPFTSHAEKYTYVVGVVQRSCGCFTIPIVETITAGGYFTFWPGFCTGCALHLGVGQLGQHRRETCPCGGHSLVLRFVRMMGGTACVFAATCCRSLVEQLSAVSRFEAFVPRGSLLLHAPTAPSLKDWPGVLEENSQPVSGHGCRFSASMPKCRRKASSCWGVCVYVVCLCMWSTVCQPQHNANNLPFLLFENNSLFSRPLGTAAD